MREIDERQGDYETIPAISMVLLMLLSTQLLVLANWDHEEEKGLIEVPKRTAFQPVSYTHLTLPTILRV